MKRLRLTFGILGGVFFSIHMISTVGSQTFHSGGVGECGGCHSMHSPKPGGTSLLVGSDVSSTCLVCHEHAGDTGPTTYHISTALADMPSGVPPKQRTPGGDFGWVKKNYTFTVGGAPNNEDGSTHGHNIVAVDFSYFADSVNTIAPGGTFQSAQLACNSCHDPHGRYRRLPDGTIGVRGAPIISSGSYNINPTPTFAEPPTGGTSLGVYRLLAGIGYTTTASGLVGFTGVPAAKVPVQYNQTEASTQVRTAYGVSSTGGHATWSFWCAACHPKMHSTGNYVHPVDRGLGTAIATIYKTYVKSGDLTGDGINGFSSLVPFAENTVDYAILASHAKNDNSVLTGPGDTDQVMCLTCHRAHASGWVQALRWNMQATFIVYNALYPGIDTTPDPPELARGRTSIETQAAYYDRPVSTFASFQKVLCNKCHAMD